MRISDKTNNKILFKIAICFIIAIVIFVINYVLYINQIIFLDNLDSVTSLMYGISSILLGLQYGVIMSINYSTKLTSYTNKLIFNNLSKINRQIVMFFLVNTIIVIGMKLFNIYDVVSIALSSWVISTLYIYFYDFNNLFKMKYNLYEFKIKAIEEYEQKKFMDERGKKFNNDH